MIRYRYRVVVEPRGRLVVPCGEDPKDAWLEAAHQANRPDCPTVTIEKQKITEDEWVVVESG